MMTLRKENHLDDIFLAMGELKTFTILQAMVMGLYVLNAAYQLLGNVFICRGVVHQCARAPNNSFEHLSGLDDYPDTNLTISYQQCHIVVTNNNSVLKMEKCIYGMVYDEPKDYSAVSQFDLVCDYSSLAKFSQALVIIGQGFGAFFFTILSDRFGRKTILVVSDIGLLVIGLIIAHAPNFTVFAVFKCIAGAFQQGCVMTYTTMLLEMLTTKNRRIQALWSGLIWGLACMSLSLWAFVFRNHTWRTLQGVLSLCGLPFILQLWYGRESLRWLIANGKSKAVENIIRYATKLNKTSYERTIQAYEDACNVRLQDENGKLQADLCGQGTATGKLSLLDLLKIPRLLLNAAIMWLAWFTTALSYFAIYQTSTALAGNPYLNFFLTALIEVPNNFVLFYFLNRYGRKVTLVTVYMLISVGLIGGGIVRSLEGSLAVRFGFVSNQQSRNKSLSMLRGYHASRNRKHHLLLSTARYADVTIMPDRPENALNAVLAVTFSCVAMTGASASFTFLFFYTPEIFPTTMRNQACGVSSLMGRVGGMIAPFTGILSKQVTWGPGVLIGCLASLLCLLSYFLPETRGRKLPQTIQEVELWFSESNYRTQLKVNDNNEDGKAEETDTLAR